MDGGGDRNQPYRGAVGQTRSERCQYSAPGGAMVSIEVYRVVDVSTHPDLGARLAQGSLNVVDIAGEQTPVNVSVLYHNPDRCLCVLVIAPTARHTELAERQRVLDELRADTDTDVPAYVRDFSVVFGADELARYLEDKAERELHERRVVDLERQLAARTDELDKRTSELKRRDDTLREREQTLGEQREQLSRLEARVEELKRAMAKQGQTLARRMTEVGDKAARSVRAPDGDPEGTPLPRPVSHEDIQTHPFELMSERERAELGLDKVEEFRGPQTDRLTQEDLHGPTLETERVVDTGEDDAGNEGFSEVDDVTTVADSADFALERWIASREPQLKVLAEHQVQLAATAEPEVLDGLVGAVESSSANGAGGLDVRIQLHRQPTYPVVVLSVGASPEPRDRLDVDFNIADDNDRAILAALADNGAFQLDLFDSEYLLVKTFNVTADLSENLDYVLTSADQHLNSIGPADRSFPRARRAWQDPGYDRYGDRDARRARYENAHLDDLDSLAKVADAVAVAAEFSRPANEAYLLLVVGESLPRWSERQVHVALRAVELGLWPGEDLARIAVTHGAAPSVRELVGKLRTTFARQAAGGQRQELVDRNWRALEREAGRLGIRDSARPGARGGRGPFGGPTKTVASGTIDTTLRAQAGEGTKMAGPMAGLSFDQVVEKLDDKEWRSAAALELARRGHAQGLEPVFGALEQMTRSEAVQVLGGSVAFGQEAAPHLIRGLGSRKGFIRHGSALALAMLRHGEGIEKICDLLLSEPTDVWREVARAVGHVGAPAVMSLIARLRTVDDERRARIAWALANIAARGTRGPVETLAQGRDPEAAAVAIRALELEHDARNDDAEVHGRVKVADQTVNRAFSRQFFEAMNATESGEDVLMLDDSDLLEADA